MPPLLPGERPPRLSNREIDLVTEQNRGIAEMIEQQQLHDYDIMHIDNRSESYRNHEEASLFVSREPQVIRPPEDTGVRYGFDETEQTLQISLENVPKKPEYESTSLRIGTGHRLCQACVDVLNYYCRYLEERIEYNKRPKEERSPRFKLSNSVIHHFNIFSLHVWASVDQCFWCQKLMEQLEYRYGNALNPGNWEDFRTEKTSQLRLVSPGLTPDQFVSDREWITLSHCWGAWGAQNNPILTRQNFSERQETGLLMADLPKTFQEAIEIAGWYNVSWIWIDCLCIIQDSSSDWQYEASKMSEIYQNALINISADSGIDSRAGCFVTRDPLSITTLSISAPQLKQTWQALPVATHLFAWTSQTPSFSRAWIHRERQLARRVLHFTETEIVWECCGIDGASFASEMLPSGAPFKQYLFGQDPKYQIGRLQQGLMEGEEETYASWNDVCERMSEKMLTKPEDMPIVLAGLAKDFSHVLPEDEYLAGLWRKMLPLGLLGSTRRFKSDDLGCIAPSWSWLSTNCAVTLANRSALESKHSLVEILHIKIDQKYEDAYGSVEKGAIELEGILRKIRISFNKETDPPELNVFDHEDDEEMRYIGPSWEPYQGHLFKLELDSQIKTLDLECFCLLVTIQQWSDHSSDRDISCLLLKPSEKEENVFERIGILVLNDLYAFKMRYRLVEKVEEEKWVEMQGVIGDVQDGIINERREKQRRDKEADVKDTQEDEQQHNDEEDHDDAAIDEGVEEVQTQVKVQNIETSTTEEDIDDEDNEYNEGHVSPDDSIADSSPYLQALYQFDGPVYWNTSLQKLSPQKVTII